MKGFAPRHRKRTLVDEEYDMNITQSTPVRLYLLQLALIEGGTPLPGYLIQMGDGKNVEWQTLLEMSEKMEH